MIIGIDGNEANVANRVGVSVYTFELLKYFHSQASNTHSYVVFTRNQPLPHMPQETDTFKYVVVPGPGMWRDIFLPFYLYTHPRLCDVFFSPAHYTPRFSPVPCVVTIHDVAYHYFPKEFLKKDLYKLHTWTRHALNQSKHVIAVSEATKNDIVKIYKTSADKISVIHNGYKAGAAASQLQARSILSDFHIIHGSYVLYVGTLQPRKDIPTLIKAFAQLLKTRPQLKLVIAGRKGWLYDEIFKLTQELSLSERVIFTGYVLDEALAALYSNAAVFVLPALYEGFGMPVLEAMHYKCPVIATATAPLMEVGGEACIYFQPHDTMDLQQKVERVLSDAKLRKSLVEKGVARVKKFSWSKAAQQTLDIITK